MRVIWARGDVGDVGGPVLPVGAVADLVDDPGVDGVAPFARVEQRELSAATSADGVAARLRPSGRRRPRPMPMTSILRVALVELELVDHGVEALVV